MALNKYILLFIVSFISLSCREETKKSIQNINSKNLITDNKNIQSIGKNIFNGVCATCHLYGTGGGTSIMDSKLWSKIIQTKKIEQIYNNVLNGYNSNNGIMPKRGGCFDCSDQDLIDAVNYIFSFNNISVTD